jgi:Fic family protein
MKMPQTPPDYFRLLPQVLESPDRYMAAMEMVQGGEQAGRYRHWDIIRHMSPPGDLSREEWWALIKMHRSAGMKSIPLRDTRGRGFGYNVPDSVAAQLHEIDLGAGGTIGVPEPLLNSQSRNQYLFRSLVQEAITSSQLEGAVTTREVAKEMIRTGRAPRDQSEQMILNNYLTMQEIRTWKARPLTPDLVLEIHRCVTTETLAKPEAAGRLRQDNEPVYVLNELTGEVFHTPPPSRDLPQRIEQMCRFANAEEPAHFLHPVLRAILLHFWLAYDHPFVHGNGRTARALFYWSMLRQQYWLFEYISISEILLRAPAKYALAFLHTETDRNDLTYFIVHQATVIRRAIQELHVYIQRKAQELASTEAVLKSGADLNHGQGSADYSCLTKRRDPLYDRGSP